MRYALFALAVACGSGNAETDPDPSTPADATAGHRSDTDVDGLATALADGAQLIDVRTEAEFAAGHVPGAVHLPLGFSTDDARLDALSHDEPVYVICQSGGRSSRAADQLARAGFRAINVEGGTGEWQASGREVQR